MLVLLYLISIILYQAFADGAELPVTTTDAKAFVAKYTTENKMQQRVKAKVTKAYCANVAMMERVTAEIGRKELGWEVDVESLAGIEDMKAKLAAFKKLIIAKGLAYCDSMLVLSQALVG